MKYFYDCEFAENGWKIDLISIAFVAEDGHELYLINGEFHLEAFDGHPWLVENVVPHLPVRSGGEWTYPDGSPTLQWEWDESHPDYERNVFSRAEMRQRITRFMSHRRSFPELWADCGPYDHVALMQLWGSMVDKPPFLPSYTNDLQQLLRDRVISNRWLPEHAGREHHALDDARHLTRCYEWVIDRGFRNGS